MEKYIVFTESEFNYLIENYVCAVWEATNEHDMAISGYALACILDYMSTDKNHTVCIGDEPKKKVLWDEIFCQMP